MSEDYECPWYMLPPASRIRALIDLVLVALVVIDVVRLPLDAAWDRFGHLRWYDLLSPALTKSGDNGWVRGTQTGARVNVLRTEVSEIVFLHC